MTSLLRWLARWRVFRRLVGGHWELRCFPDVTKASLEDGLPDRFDEWQRTPFCTRRSRYTLCCEGEKAHFEWPAPTRQSRAFN